MSEHNQIAIRLADEGVPIQAIARALPDIRENLREVLAEAVENGTLIELPRADWPPGSSRSSRASSVMIAKPVTNERLQMDAVRYFHLTNLQAKVFALLVRVKEANKQQIHDAIERDRKPGDDRSSQVKMIDVVVCHLRKRLKPHKLKIETIWGAGYYMTPGHQKRAMEIIDGFVRAAE